MDILPLRNGFSFLSTVRGVIARAERAGGDPVAPRGHKKRKLDSGEGVKLCRALEQNSTATNRQLSAVVRGKVAARTVSDYLARADPPFTNEGYPRSRTRRIALRSGGQGCGGGWRV